MAVMAGETVKNSRYLYATSSFTALSVGRFLGVTASFVLRTAYKSLRFLRIS